MKILKHLLTAAACAALPFAASAQQPFPNHPVTIVVPNAPGGAVDILARLLEKNLSDTWKQPVIVQYKPGAGTVMGTDFVAKSAPDGHTLGLVITGHMINPSLRRNMPFDTLKDLSGVTLLATSPIVLTAYPKLSANNVKELVALAKAKNLSYASPGSGSSMHLGAELLKSTAGIDILHTPYKGSGGAYPDVMAGRVDLLVDPLFSSLPYIKSGHLKADRDHECQALAHRTGDPHRGRNPARLRGRERLRRRRAFGHAQGRRAQDQRRHGQGTGLARGEAGMAEIGLTPVGQHAGAVRRLHPCRDPEVGQGREGLGRHRRLRTPP
jgi:hypothetical protein